MKTIISPRLLLRLALRNLLGTGLRFYINLAVLAITVLLILLLKGIWAGMGLQMVDTVVTTEIGSGQWQALGYDAQDSMTFNDAVAALPAWSSDAVAAGEICPQLLRTATLYVQGRPLAVTLRGIDPLQTVLDLPTAALRRGTPAPVDAGILIGARMAELLGVAADASVTLKWRDSRGAFDALDMRIATVFETTNPRIDTGTVWMDLALMQRLCGLEDKGSLVVFSPRGLHRLPAVTAGWTPHPWLELTEPFRLLARTKEKSGSVILALLLFLAGVGIFNTQLLSVYKRRREIGTLVALGMTPAGVGRLLVMEGALTAILGIVAGVVCGFPLLYWTARYGIPVKHTRGMNLPIPERLYAHFEPWTLLAVIGFVALLMSLVAWWPARRVAGLDPARALAGRES